MRNAICYNHNNAILDRAQNYYNHVTHTTIGGYYLKAYIYSSMFYESFIHMLWLIIMVGT